MISKLRKKIVLFTVLMIAAITIAFTIGVDIYLIKKTERELYSSMSATIEQTQKDEKDKTEIGNGDFKNMAMTEICVVKITKNSDGERTITNLSENSYLSDDSLTAAIDAILGKYNLSIPTEVSPGDEPDPPPQPEDSQTPTADKNPQENNQPPQINKRFEGTLSNLSLVYDVQSEQNGIFIAFADLNYLHTENKRTALLSTTFDLAILIISFVIAVVLSKILVHPVEKSIEEQKRFIADASHELKTPLAVISANNQILLSDATDTQKEWLTSTTEEIKVMNDVLRDMLTLAAGEALSTLAKTNENISKIADGTCLQFDAVAFEKNIDLSIDIQENIYLDCDEKMLRRLFAILVDNAIKYEPNGGKILVSLNKTGNKAIFSVKNFGSVVKKEDLPHLFERFYRADKSRSTNGVGLGLAIAKNIVDLHGGNIKVVSSETAGTTFIAEF